MIEIERKYIIMKPDIEYLKELLGYSESKILQIYLNSENSVTHRIRRREFQSSVVYTETKKRRIDKMSAEELEREITKEEFDSLALNVMTGTKPLNKIRYTFRYLGKLFEVDIYPEWESTAILETELVSRDEAVAFPEFIRVVKEVTGNPAYSNASMSKKFPEESRV